mgnify:CR=1 FL=1
MNDTGSSRDVTVDGRLFVADYKKALLVLDVKTAKLEPILETAYSEGFKGLNDLHFTDFDCGYFSSSPAPAPASAA